MMDGGQNDIDSNAKTNILWTNLVYSLYTLYLVYNYTHLNIVTFTLKHVSGIKHMLEHAMNFEWKSMQRAHTFSVNSCILI